MASYHHRPDRKSKPHQVRYRKPDGSQGSQSFRTKSEAIQAQARLTVQEAKWLRGEDLPQPKQQVPTVRDWADVWYQHYDVSAGTKEKRLGALRTWINPHLGDLKLDELRALHIGHMMAAMRDAGRSKATQTTAYQTLCLVLDYAVANGKASDNVARLLNPPKGEGKRKPYPFTPEELSRLLEQLSEPHRLMCRFAAIQGLRWGELNALTPSHLDLSARSLLVEVAVKRGGGIGTTKSKRPRLLPLADSLVEPLAERVGERPATEPIWGPLHRSNFRTRIWLPAVAAAGLDGHTFHDLRHTAASRLIQRGASVKAVQEFLGHASAVTTLNTYIHLFPGELEGLRGFLD